MHWCQKLAALLVLSSLAFANDLDAECGSEWKKDDIVHMEHPTCKAPSFAQVCISLHLTISVFTKAFVARA